METKMEVMFMNAITCDRMRRLVALVTLLCAGMTIIAWLLEPEWLTLAPKDLAQAYSPERRAFYTSTRISARQVCVTWTHAQPKLPYDDYVCRNVTDYQPTCKKDVQSKFWRKVRAAWCDNGEFMLSTNGPISDQRFRSWLCSNPADFESYKNSLLRSHREDRPQALSMVFTGKLPPAVGAVVFLAKHNFTSNNEVMSDYFVEFYAVPVSLSIWFRDELMNIKWKELSPVIWNNVCAYARAMGPRLFLHDPKLGVYYYLKPPAPQTVVGEKNFEYTKQEICENSLEHASCRAYANTAFDFCTLTVLLLFFSVFPLLIIEEDEIITSSRWGLTSILLAAGTVGMGATILNYYSYVQCTLLSMVLHTEHVTQYTLRTFGGPIAFLLIVSVPLYLELSYYYRQRYLTPRRYIVLSNTAQSKTQYGTIVTL